MRGLTRRFMPYSLPVRLHDGVVGGATGRRAGTVRGRPPGCGPRRAGGAARSRIRAVDVGERRVNGRPPRGCGHDWSGPRGVVGGSVLWWVGVGPGRRRPEGRHGCHTVSRCRLREAVVTVKARDGHPSRPGNDVMFAQTSADTATFGSTCGLTSYAGRRPARRHARTCQPAGKCECERSLSGVYKHWYRPAVVAHGDLECRAERRARQRSCAPDRGRRRASGAGPDVLSHRCLPGGTSELTWVIRNRPEEGAMPVSPVTGGQAVSLAGPPGTAVHPPTPAPTCAVIRRSFRPGNM